jgi:Ca2+-binding RTX toxin-like protein
VDLFRYTSPSQGNDSITDFVPGVDKIQVVGSAFGGLAAGALPANNFVVSNGTPAATQAVPQFLYNTTTGVLAFDADGTGGSAAVNLVTLVGQPAITAVELLVAGA